MWFLSMTHNLWRCNGVNMVKQGIRCDAWLSPWFLFYVCPLIGSMSVWVPVYVFMCVIKLMRSCEYVLPCMYWHSAETSRMALPYTCMESSFLPPWT